MRERFARASIAAKRTKSAAEPAKAAVGSVAGQAVVQRVGFRPVAAAGMTLMGVGCLLLTQVSVGGSYFGDIFLGLLIFGPGIGLTFVTTSIAALAGVAEQESGLASGLNNTAFQLGAALGVAVVSTVAISRTDDFLAENGAGNTALAPEGFQAGFVACVVLAAIGLVASLLFLGPRRGAVSEPVEVQPATAGD